MGKKKSLEGLRKTYETGMKEKQWAKLRKGFNLLDQVTKTECRYGWFEEVDEALS